MGGRVARYGEALEGDAGNLDRLPSAHQVFRRMWSPGDPDRGEFRVALELLSLTLRHPDLGAGSLGEIRNSAQVVEVAVRDEDPRTRGAEAGELETKICCVAAGIDHDALGSAAIAADDIAVRLERTELVSVDCQRHRGR